jgi:hypothetical protein
MSIDVENMGKIEKAKVALGSILNLIKYEPLASFEDAEMRFRLLDQFADEAFLAISEIKDSEFPGEEYAGILRSCGIYLGRGFDEPVLNAEGRLQ